MIKATVQTKRAPIVGASVGTWATITTSGLLPILMAATGSLPPSLNDPESWIPWILGVGGPLGGWVIVLAGRAIATYFREKAKLLRAAAQMKLGDKDPKNDAIALKELAKAAGFEAAAELLEQRAQKR